MIQESATTLYKIRKKDRYNMAKKERKKEQLTTYVSSWIYFWSSDKKKEKKKELDIHRAYILVTDRWYRPVLEWGGGGVCVCGGGGGGGGTFTASQTKHYCKWRDEET